MFPPFAAYPITVMIVDTSYPDQGTEYIPGSSVQLHCLADSRFAPVVTTWNSTCNGSCFVLQQTLQEVIMTDVLHSTDSGKHSCTVVDDVGNTGHATIEMNIVGEHNVITISKMSYTCCYKKVYYLHVMVIHTI